MMYSFINEFVNSFALVTTFPAIRIHFDFCNCLPCQNKRFVMPPTWLSPAKWVTSFLFPGVVFIKWFKHSISFSNFNSID
ncbi:hypothetical protein Bpfe_023725 [Biomphalaria pfeifferi]|uniref:Uncharacterized protein n=1 Tax=Biomphalaria pfeifferi TaxID=112525 RepID=A0AAD8B2J8_BIOPF|nr:hypothetical protein Bpfe_023725 [Biomphalaria pfeifferi]